MVAQIDINYVRIRPHKALVRLASYALFEGRPVTTRGRWINPLVFAEFSLLKRLPDFKGVNRPLFILGTGRSGTTILGVVMSMHRQVGFLNEPKALWHAIRNDEDVIGSYSQGIGRYHLAAVDASPEVIHAARRLFGAYLALTGSRRVVDKYPELIFRIPFVKAIFPDARFIVLTRNGLDTIASIEHWSKAHQVHATGEAHDWWGVNGRKWKLMQEQLVATDVGFDGIRDIVPHLSSQKDMAAVEWIVTMREVLRQRQRDDNAMMFLKYEDLVAAPRVMLQQISDFADLAEDETYLDYGALVLKPGRHHDSPELHPALGPLFDQTMRDLGYSL